MILPAMLLGIINQEEVFIKSISFPELEFRSIQDLSNIVDLQLYVFCPKTYRYEIFESFEIEIIDKGKNRWEYLYSVLLQCKDDVQFSKLENVIKETKLFSENLNSIKFNGNIDNLIDETKFPIYPREKDKLFQKDDYIKAKYEWTNITTTIKEYSLFNEMSSKYSLSFTADRPSIYNCLVTEPIRQVFKDILQKDGLSEHPIFIAECNYLTIGNEFCPSLFPKFEQLKTLMEKSLNEKLQLTIAYPFLLQTQTEHLLRLLSLIDKFCRHHKVTVEFTINDWGILNILNKKDFPFIQPVLGRLLNKRQKDVRFQWKWKIDNFDEYLQSNMLNEPIVTEFLRKNNITRYNFEIHPHINQINGSGHTLYFPFYQINTSVYCKLYEICKKQTNAVCTRLCEDAVQLFPNHLKAVERGNTVFGFCDSLLRTSDCLQYYLAHGIDRLVYTTL